ncbi:putative ATP-binding component of ABC transporter [Vibrio ichthyoenteri ATCC 700023]|uniref:Putative ATP-binding component of ABC transporter n=1 Tax=Vibrio ichthyoenteri ATCC 700023 TaxID=870968 RepID=F9RYU5_9VIBR|nr:ATP-binding cassette domain-containing protein [Vibrio ichthyoenteri]EGU46305.1 putative ATP-binding component of ABC transporter [Vibrio ichthyoenteri ATCC 700023]
MPNTPIFTPQSDCHGLILASKLTYQFADGERIFDGITCSLNQSRTGLVGRNGAGKSLFAELLTQQRQPSSGTVTMNATIGYYSQLASQWIGSNQTIAQILQVDQALAALDRIEQGECEQRLFDQVAERWDLKQQLLDLLRHLGLPADVNLAMRHLSGGQLARLHLWQLFESDADLLVLDEPSNHLDHLGKRWLIDKVRGWQGSILLISHDRALLREMSVIWELSGGKLQQYGGNFDDYFEQKQTQQQALERQIDVVKTQQRRAKIEHQKNQQKADKRAAQGNKIRKRGGQPKILLDAMKNSAQASAASRVINQRGQIDRLDNKMRSLQAGQHIEKTITMRLHEASGSNKSMINIVNFKVPFSNSDGVSLQLSSTDKCRIHGANGCGKSTLLKLIEQQNNPELRCNQPVIYLDQHFSSLLVNQSMLDNLMHYCPDLKESDARTLLAGIGFRRDDVYRLSLHLSGGEKMKLAMTIVGHQANRPLLLLDEPDNHLDLHSKQVLSQALNHYQGALMIVSHDEDFIAEIGITQTVMFCPLDHNGRKRGSGC